MKIVKLIPKIRSKFHFGHLSLEINDHIFHSDSLFSTICWNLIKEFGKEKIEEFIKNFPKITSLFYGIKANGKEIYFLPKPSLFKITKGNKEADQKKQKKIEFISIGVYKKLVFNELTTDIIEHSKNWKLIYLIEEYNKQDLDLFDEIEDQKVAIDRTTLTTSEGNLYTVSSIILHPNAFFYFLIDTDKLSEELAKSIEKIEDFGIGGEISTGYGQIKKVEIKDLNIEQSDFRFLKEDKNKFMSLSIIFPRKRELSNVLAYYLIERKGWICYSSYRRKPLIGLREGAILNSKIEGACVNVSPNSNSKSYRFGKAFLIPFNDKIEIKEER